MKWKPSKSQRMAFTERMKQPGESEAYAARKEARAAKKRAGSQFAYTTAGGSYVPTKFQHDWAFRFMLSGIELTGEQITACNIVMSGYSSGEKVHHDYIHIVNELIRKQ